MIGISHCVRDERDVVSLLWVLIDRIAKAATPTVAVKHFVTLGPRMNRPSTTQFRRIRGALRLTTKLRILPQASGHSSVKELSLLSSLLQDEATTILQELHGKEFLGLV